MEVGWEREGGREGGREIEMEVMMFLRKNL